MPVAASSLGFPEKAERKDFAGANWSKCPGMELGWGSCPAQNTLLYEKGVFWELSRAKVCPRRCKRFPDTL